MGFEIEASHHEVAPGQHEIDFRYADALETADRVTTFRMIVKKIALDFGLHATFMPKPISGVNGSGMHTHQSLFVGTGDECHNVFYAPDDEYQLSSVALHYIGGLLEHANAFVALTNPLVNSYKRLVPGYEAPVNVAWSEHNRSPLVRVPARRGEGTRVEVRVPDPSCNPYLAFTAMLRAGLDGMDRGLDPGLPVNQNIFEMTQQQKQELNITQLPSSLNEALKNFQQDEVMREALGEHIFQNFVRAKQNVWREYCAQVHSWELEMYLSSY
jgi:glutamine synthetase